MKRLGLEYGGVDKTAEFVAKNSINVEADQRKLGQHGLDIQVLLATLDEQGSLAEHRTRTGADYQFSRLDYISPERVVASRYIATILGGKRTELAYWKKIAPAKSLTVHQGLGNLVVSNPDDSRTTTFVLDPEVTPELTLPSGRFYTFEADTDTPDPLVVSGLYYKRPNWGILEVTLDPGQEAVREAESLERGDRWVCVPNEFANRY